MKLLKIGIFSLQGDVSEHIVAMERALDLLGIEGKVGPIVNTNMLAEVDGVVLPGGESSTIYRLLRDSGMFELLQRRCRVEKMPILGTCAGMVLLAKKGDVQVASSNTNLLGFMDVSVIRNAFGRQKYSFEAMLDIVGENEPFPAVFIRAPAYDRVFGDVQVLARVDELIVLAKQNNILACSFHPELTEDTRIHGLFLNMFPGIEV